LKLAGFCRGGNSLKDDSHWGDDRLGRHHDEHSVGHPLAVKNAFVAALKGIGAQIV
jgi:hypothetical protein